MTYPPAKISICMYSRFVDRLIFTLYIVVQPTLRVLVRRLIQSQTISFGTRQMWFVLCLWRRCIFPTGIVKEPRRNVFHDERTKAELFRRLTWCKSALGYPDGLVEHQSDFVLRHGWGKFLGYGAERFFLVYFMLSWYFNVNSFSWAERRFMYDRPSLAIVFQIPTNFRLTYRM